MIVFYLGPDSLLPLGSILAAVAGFILLFWNRITGVFRKGRKTGPADSDEASTGEAESPDPPNRSGT
jgi:hypothetical protein